MRVAADEGRIVSSTTELLDYFRSGSRPRDRWRVGVEHEKLAVRRDGRPVPFAGANGIAALLGQLSDRGWEPHTEDGQVVSLEREGERVTLEPGGQIEQSSLPRSVVTDCAAAIRQHVSEVAAAASSLDITLIAGGLRPFGSLAEVPWSSKRRYALMRVELPGRGELAREMMQSTTAVHTNVDFSDEGEAVEKLRAALSVTSVVTAICAASPISGGRPNGYRSRRAAVWLKTDESRAGILPFMLSENARLDDYVSWVTDVPVLMVSRGGSFRPTRGATFRQLIEKGFEGQPVTMGDWDLHLSTIFPEVRLRTYLEMRGADSGPLGFVYAIPALWRGLLDDSSSRRACLELTAGATSEERLELRRTVPRLGLQTVVGRWQVASLARELLAVARAGLRRLPGGEDDSRLLDPMQELVSQSICPADLMLRDWEETRGHPSALVRRWALA